jgi:large subunit ribosomal protein L6
MLEERFYLKFGKPMSKIGQKPVSLDGMTQIELNEGSIKVTGKDCTLTLSVPYIIAIEKTEKELLIGRKNDSKSAKALHGLTRSLVQNAVTGVNKPWEKRLEVVGTGYRVKMQGADIVLEVGYSHPIIFKPIEGIHLSIEGNNKIIVKGIDKQKVGEVAYQIKVSKKPDPYKGKGVRYEGEHIKLKAGKKAKTAGAK